MSQERPAIDFRAQTAGKDHLIVIHVDGQHDGTVFTFSKDEPREVIARRLTNAFRDMLMLGIELGMQNTPIEAIYQEKPRENERTIPDSTL